MEQSPPSTMNRLRFSIGFTCATEKSTSIPIQSLMESVAHILKQGNIEVRGLNLVCRTLLSTSPLENITAQESSLNEVKEENFLPSRLNGSHG